MTASDMRGSREEGYMSLPNTREDESQIAWRTVPTPCLNQMSLPLPSWLINSFHGIQVAATLYIFFSWGFVPASKLECTLHVMHLSYLSLPGDIPATKWPWLVKGECNHVPCPAYLSLVQ